MWTELNIKDGGIVACDFTIKLFYLDFFVCFNFFHYVITQCKLFNYQKHIMEKVPLFYPV